MNKETLLVAEAVSNERGLNKEVIFKAMESALEMATKKKSLDKNMSVKVEIDRKTGEYQTWRTFLVVSDTEYKEYIRHRQALQKAIHLSHSHQAIHEQESNEIEKISCDLAKEKKADAKIGETISEAMESVEFGRIAAQRAKQVILQKVFEAERQKVADSFQDKKGQIIHGTIKEMKRDFALVDLGSNAEAFLPRSNMIPHEAFRVGDRIRATLKEISMENVKGPQLILSRTSPEFLVALFRVEVPEISEEIIEIRAAARDPGSRAKIAVKTNDGRIDPVGACVGMRGARVQAVSTELGGERIDIILWNDNPAQLVINAMSPAEVASIVLDEDAHTMDIAVRSEQLSQAIGRHGQNVRLASELTGWTLNVMSEEEAKNKASQEEDRMMKLFMDKLGADEEIAALLVREGFSTLEEIAYVPVEELLEIKEIESDIVHALRERAESILLTKAIAEEQVLENAEPAEDLLAMDGMDRHLAYQLASRGVITREDLAEQSVDDLLDLAEMTQEKAGQLIMTARQIWFN